MARWGKNQKEFEVSVNQDERRGYQSTMPKPVMALLGFPKRIRFVIDGNKVRIEKIEKEKN